MCNSCLNCLTDLYDWVLSFCCEKHSEDERIGGCVVNIDDQYMRLSLYELKKKDLIDDIETNNKQNTDPNIELIIGSDNKQNNENEWDVMENFSST
jgi:hypothetical protein